MKLIGLTGGIGSGKSTVADIFSTLGIPVYESDSRARDLMNNERALKEKIVQLFGPESYSNGDLNRKWMAEKVFPDKDLLQQLNAIVHPAVKADALQWANSTELANAPYVIKESAILFEEDLTSDLDAIILVVAPVELRIDRVMNRDGISKAQVEERIQHQWTDDKKIPVSDFVIFNDGERSLIEQVRDIDQMIRAI